MYSLSKKTKLLHLQKMRSLSKSKLCLQKEMKVRSALWNKVFKQRMCPMAKLVIVLYVKKLLKNAVKFSTLKKPKATEGCLFDSSTCCRIHLDSALRPLC